MEKMINARNLLSNKRLDLVAKYLYVEHKIQGYSDDWARELYIKHLEVMTDSSCCEPVDPQNLYDAFDGLIEDIQVNGLVYEKDKISVGANRLLINDSHYAAVCAYLNMDVPSEMLNQTGCFDYFYFKKKNLSDTYLDYIVTKYTKLFPEKCFVICMWPRACAKKELMAQADEIIHKTEKIQLVAVKTLTMNAHALRNFAIHCYCGRDWVADAQHHFAGVETMTLSRYDTSNEMRAYVVESPDLETIVELKKQIRELFQMEFFAAHSSDNPVETQMMMQMLFNANSLDMMNRGCVDYDVNLVKKIMDFKETVIKNSQHLENFILDASAVMGLYKLSKVKNMGYLSVDGQKVSSSDADDHGDNAPYYDTSVETLLRDPRKHLYVMGVKCITLDVLCEFKENRGCEEDKRDLRKIRKKQQISFSLRGLMDVQWMNFRVVLRDAKTTIRDFLEKNNIHFFTKLWHWLRREGFQ